MFEMATHTTRGELAVASDGLNGFSLAGDSAINGQ
jgi:hypothetical protein